MRILMAQIDTTVVDFDGNLAAIASACDRARAAGDDLVLTPELALTGYPPLDLLERPDMLHAAVERLPDLAACSRGLVLVAGLALPATHAAIGPVLRPAVNAAAVFQDGTLVAIVRKRLLPTYDVFDEDRYFQPGHDAVVLPLCGRRLGITICEDIWSRDDNGPPRYAVDPVAELVEAGADCILNLSASPFDLGKAARRLQLVHAIAVRHGLPIAYCNLVGGNDALIFDGRSFALDGLGRVLATGPAFQVADVRVTLPAALSDVTTRDPPPPLDLPLTFAPSHAEEARAALVLGVRDYVRKCGFRNVLIGLSGGIDSAVTAAIAVQALGAEHVTGVAMPGPYSSDGSVTDALALADALGIRCPIVEIRHPYAAILTTLEPELTRTPGSPTDITHQNIQARIRGLVLMALSNRTGAMVLTTGNKSELAVGYCTLYGDMNGGLAVIGDLPKLLVYDVARTYPAIPASTLDKPPSAELAPDQRDDDNLPPYPVLDAILELHVMENLSAEAIIARGFDAATVRRVVRLVELNEYKRRQAAPVLRVTRKAFGGGRRIPMARKLPGIAPPRSSDA